MHATRRREPGLSFFIFTLLCALGTAGPATAADDPARISGTVVSIDLPGRTLLLEEIGAAAPAGSTAAHVHTIQLAPDTVIWLLQRQASTDAGGWPGGFTALRIGAGEMRPGDFATVRLNRNDARRSDARQEAMSIDVIRPPAGARSSLGGAEPAQESASGPRRDAVIAATR